MRPVLFELNFNSTTIPIYSYGLFSILSLVLVIVLTLAVFRRNRISWGRSISGVAIIAISTVIGARLLGILSKYPVNGNYAYRIFAFSFKDFSLMGGLIFAILAGYIFLKVIKQNILKISDDLVFVVGGGMIVWRIGCLLNACCSGKETGSVFGIRYPGTGQSVHPTQLYEIVAILLILLVLFFVSRKLKKHGMLSFIFYTWFAVSYTVISFFREHTIYTLILSIALSAVLWVTVFIIGLTELRAGRTSQ